MRCLRWMFRFDLAPICLAFAIVFFGAVGSMAHDHPIGTFVAGTPPNTNTFNGSSPIAIKMSFDRTVLDFGVEDIALTHPDAPTGCHPTISDFSELATPSGAVFVSFNITPKLPLDINVTVGTGFQYLEGSHAGSYVGFHEGAVSQHHTIRYVGEPFASATAVPVADAGDEQLVQSGTLVTLEGTGSTEDCSNSLTYTWTRTGGTGNGEVVLSGSNTSQLSFTADTLVRGANNVTHVFELVVANDMGTESVADTVTVTVESPYASPVAEAGQNQWVGPGVMVTLDGTDSTVDRRRTIASYFWERTHGTEGASVILSDATVAKPKFTADTLAPGADNVTHVFLLTVTDSGSETVVDTVSVTVVASTADPVAHAGDDQTVSSGAKVTLDGRRSTADRRIGIGLYSWKRTSGTGGPVTLSDASSDQPTFTADTPVPGAADVTHVFTLTVTDNADVASTDTVTITVTAPFAGPVANAGPDQPGVASGATVTLDGSGSTVDRRRPITYAWARTSGTGSPVTLSDASAAQPSFPADTLAPGAADVTHVFKLTVTDNKDLTSTDTVTITVIAPFAAPVANAGEDQTGIASGTTVTLDGSGSVDRRRTIKSYAWARTSGTGGSVTLSGASTEQLTFMADILPLGAEDVTHVFTLTVTDSEGVADTDTVTVTVTSGHAAPVANAGMDGTVGSGAWVTLDGRGSTVDRRRTIASYTWKRTGGTGRSVTLSGASTARPGFTADTLEAGAADVTHIFSLIVRDSEGYESAADTVTVTVISENARPVANAGPDQTVASGSIVYLDGSESRDIDGTIVEYLWAATPYGSPVKLINERSVRASFTAQALEPGAANVRQGIALSVRDNEGAISWASSVMYVTITSPFKIPMADAGKDQTVASGAEVRLDGSGSTTDRRRNIQTWRWQRTGGTVGATVALSDPRAERPTFTADTLAADAADVTHVFTLTVSDESRTLVTDVVTVTVTAGDVPPVADAGEDQTVDSGKEVTLDGSGSTVDRRRTITSYAWDRTSGTAGATVALNDPSAERPTFTADTLADGAADVTHVFTLTVTDSANDTATDTVTVTVIDPIAAPVADAGEDQTVDSGKEVTLDGSGSTSDHSRSITSYSWEWIGGRGADSVTLTDAKTAMPSFTAETLDAGALDVTHDFELTVTDSAGDTSTDTVTVTVTSPNAIPVADAGPDLTVASGVRFTLNGRGSSDKDGTIASYKWRYERGGEQFGNVFLSRVNGPEVTLSRNLAPGAADWIYVISLVVTDNEGAVSKPDTVMVTVTNSGFAAPVADAGPDQDDVGSGTTVQLDGSGSTHDSRTTATYAWTRTGGDGDASVALSDPSAERPTFTADTLEVGAPDVTHEFTLTVTDDQGGRSTDTVTITVEAPPFEALVAEAGEPQTVDAGDTVTLAGSGTATGGGRTVTYAWTQTGGDAATVALSDTTVLDPRFTAQTLTAGAADVTYVFTLTVTDNKGSTAATDTVTITVEAPPFEALVAEAGEPQTVDAGDTVTLAGSGTATGGGRTVTYAWTQTGGDAATVALSDTTVLDPRFTAQTLTAGAADVTYVFTLTVTDNKGSTAATDTVTITVEAPPFEALVAEAGEPQTVDAGDTVTLAGSGTATGGGRTVTYAWTQTGGDAATVALSDTTVLDPRFTAQTLTAGAADVTYVFTLTVTDNKGSTAATDTVTITVEAPPFEALVAEAGEPQTVDAGDTVTLAGSGTATGGGRTVTYAWTQTGGDAATVALSDTTVLDPRFTAQTLTAGAADVTYVFTLTVTDNKGSTAATDTVTITVEAPPFEALVAEAGEPQTVDAGDTVTLAGSGTATGGGRTVTYAWTQTGGDAATVTLSDTTVLDPRFTAQTLTAGAADVTYVFTLTVTDNKGSTAATDTVTITVEAPPFEALVAEAGEPQTVDAGDTVTLAGSGTATGGGRTVTYAWTQTGGDAATVALSDTTVLDPRFTAQTLTAGAADVTYVFTLTVTDNKGSTAATDTVTITVEAPPFEALVAEAGEPQTVDAGDTVTLAGSGTATGGGRTVTYAWTQTGGDAATVALSDTTVLDPRFTAQTLTAGAADVTYVFTLTVTDNKGSTAATDTVTITVEAPPFEALVAEAGEPQTVDAGDTVTLAGSGTATGGGRTVTYAWTQTGGDAATVALSDTTVLDPRFTAQTLTAGAADVTYVFTLTVTDNKGSTAATDTVTITVEAPPFEALVAEAGEPQTVDAGDTVTLAGSGTATGGGRTVTYAWTQTGGDAATVALSDTTVLDPRFTAQTLTAGAADVTYVFTLTVTDNKGSTAATDTVTITVEAPPFEALVAEAGEPQTVDAGDTVTLAGSGTATGGGRTVTYAWTQTGGDAATVALSDTTVLDPRFTAQTLTAGAADVTYVFTLTVTDNKGSTAATDTVTITVEAPPFEALVAEAGEPQTVDAGDTVTLAGSGTATGGGRTVTYAWTQTGGDAATVALSDTTVLDPRFTAQTLTAGAADVTYVFTLTVTDNKGSTAATDTVTITVEAPPFEALVAEAGEPQTVDAGDTVTLAGSGTATGGGRTVTYAWTQTGGDAATVALSDTTVLDPRFTAQTLTAGAADVTYVFTLTVTDNKGSTAATDTVTITVEAPPFEALVAEAGEPQTVDAGDTVTLAGSGTATGGGRTVTYAWTQTGGDAATVTLSDTTVLDPRFTAQTLTAGAADVTYVFTLTVTDNKGSTAATDTVTITVEAPPFEALVAEAGEPQTVDAGDTVTLAGSGTATGGGRTVTYAWTQTGGDAATVTLSDTTVLDPRFTAQTLTAGAADVTYVFTLTVTDNKGSTAATDTVTITVEAPPFEALVAEAGEPQTVDAGDTVTLAGSGTATGGGRTVTYAWTQTGGDAATVALSDTTVLDPRFTAQTLTAGAADVTYVFTLTVTDNKGSTAATDTVTITVEAPPFEALVAEAGEPQTVDAGDTVTLAGSGTATGGGRTVTYAWTQTGGDAATVTLSDTTVLDPRFTAQTLTAGAADVTYVFTLTVTDNKGSTAATDTVTITVEAPPFEALVAEAGEPQTVDAGDTVTLAGSGTATGGGRTVTYAWTQTGGDAATVALSDTTVLDPRFTAQTLTAGAADVTYVFTLTVTDNKGSTAATDTVTITVTSRFAAPVANAGPDQDDVGSGMTVQLDGSGSTHDSRTTAAYTWTRTGGDGDASVALNDPSAERPTFTAQTLADGADSVTYILTLTVTDSRGRSDTDTVTITVIAPDWISGPNAAPVAEAGEDQKVASGTTVTLDGSGSMDRDGMVASYSWRRTTGTSDDIMVLANENMPQISFTADTLAPGTDDVTHIFELVVTDNEGAVSEPDTVTVTISSVAQFEVDILVSSSELTVQEGGSSAYQVKLSRSTGQEVSVIAFSGNEDVVLENAHLVFDEENWDAWQEVRIGTVADSDNADDAALIQHSLVAQGVALGQSGVVSVTVREEELVLRPIGKFLETRLTTLLNNQPDLLSFLNQDGTPPGGSGGFTFKAADGRLALNGGFVRDGVWGKVTGSYTSSDSGDIKSVLGSFGIHRKYSERFLAGVMLQFDLAEHELAGQAGTIDGTGWLAGPYFAARHGTQPLYFEGRLLYGQSNNDIRFNDPGLGKEQMGSFDTKRLFAQLRVEGEIALSDGDGGPRLIPYADGRWIKDRAAAFSDSIGNRVPGQKVSVGQLELGSNVEIPIAMSHGAMTFTGGLGMVYSSTEGDYFSSESRSRGRGEIGFSYGLDDNVQIDFESFYDGIGTSGYEGYGLSLSAEMKF